MAEVTSDAQFQVGPDTVVHFAYRLYDEEEELVEGSEASVFSFLYGYGQLVPAVENALLGLSPGQERRIQLAPGEAFGPRNPEAIIEVSRDEFPPDIGPGDEFEAEREDGDCVSLAVLEVGEDFVVVDTNHPLAGQSVTMWLRVEAVRPALTAEIEEAVQLLENGQTPPPSLLPATSLVRRPSTLDPPDPRAFDSEQPDTPATRPR